MAMPAGGPRVVGVLVLLALPFAGGPCAAAAAAPEGGASIRDVWVCGGTAPETSSCTTGKHRWSADRNWIEVAWCPAVGACEPFTGELSARVEGRTGSFSWTCTVVAGVALEECAEAGTRPSDGTRVVHTCDVSVAAGFFAPAGEWFCAFFRAPAS
jgi:hypothetical protein